LPPKLENRELDISPEVPGFEYWWRECTKTGIFGGCRKWEMRVEYYDLTKPDVRQKLIDMGFVGRSKKPSLP
jgi:hypothetical protein